MNAAEKRLGLPTPKQRAYLDFIGNYRAVHRRSPSEADMQAYFCVSPPAVHRMVIVLAEKGLIEREPGAARSIRIVEASEAAPTPADEDSPSRPPGDIYAPIDPEIAPLVEALRASPTVVTKASCSGHGKRRAYVDLAVDGVAGMRRFVERMNVLDREFAAEAILDVRLNWSHEVVTSCAFDVFPNWIMLSWVIEGLGSKRAPSAGLLMRIAKVYRAV